MKNKIIPIIFIAIISFSCTKEIKFTGGEIKPMLVINSLAVADSVVVARVSRSVFFLDNSRQSPAIDNAAIAVFVNEQSIGNMTFVRNDGYDYDNGKNYYTESVYTLNNVLHQGDKVRIEANAPNFPTVLAETSIPVATPVISLDTMTKTDNFGSSKRTYKIKFQDNPDQTNYYQITGKYIYWLDIYNMGTTFERYENILPLKSDDIVFGNNNALDGVIESSNNKYNVFSDDLINGKEYSIEMYEDYYRSSGNTNVYNDTIKIILKSISREYYLYLKTLMANENSDGFGMFAEPVQIFSNMQNGIGILGGVSQSEKIISIKPQSIYWEISGHFLK